MTVRAKFFVAKIDKTTTTRYVKDEQGALIPNEVHGFREEQVEVANITMYPVVSANSSAENVKFFAATPGGMLQLSTVNPEAWKQFEQGKEYYLDFSEAPVKEPAQV